MKTMKIENQEDLKNTQLQGKTVEVLYQKMGDRWFAFSLIDDEVFMGSIAQSEIDHECPGYGVKKHLGNS